MSANDSIVAAATPAGESALAVVRVSGTLCSCLVESALGVPCPTPRRAYLSGYRDLDEALLDEVIFVFYDEGKSYTGEASLEISSHGNSLITKKIIEPSLRKNESQISNPTTFHPEIPCFVSTRWSE